MEPTEENTVDPNQHRNDVYEAIDAFLGRSPSHRNRTYDTGYDTEEDSE